MKNFYDLGKQKQKDLRKEFRKKYGSVKKGLIIGGCLITPYIILLFTDEEFLHTIAPGYYALMVITIIASGIIESCAFTNWLKSRDISS